MKENIEYFLGKINKDNKIILSLDLDNTLVNRDKGANYVYGPTLFLLKKFLKDKNRIIILPNTGRDPIGFRSFCDSGLKIENAVLGSGSIILMKGELIFNKKSKIAKAAWHLLLTAVKNEILPFVDFSFMNKRAIFFGSDEQYEDLFFSQNPKEWFGKTFPKSYNVKGADKLVGSDSVFRIEFPVFDYQTSLYEELINKKENCSTSLAELLDVDGDFFKGYSLKRKVFFNKKYTDRAIFARFEKQSDSINKGAGLKKWIEEAGLKKEKATIIHIGDRDFGIVNDTLIKKDLPNAFVVMMGEKCRLDNPMVDLYLRGGETDLQLYNFLKSLSHIIS